MTAISTFENPVFGQIRAIKGDRPLFIGKDVAASLGYNNHRDAIARHCRGVVKHDGYKERGQLIALIPESDVYRLIMRSNLPQAEAFQDWVTEEVLPAIRKTGGYMVSHIDETPEEIMARALLVAHQTIERQRSKVESMKEEIDEYRPKALFADAVTTSSDSILVGEMAVVLKQNGIDIGQNRFFDWLRENGYLCSHGEKWNLPTQRSMDLKIMEVKERTHNEPSGEIRVTRTTKITGKGQVYFVNKFLAAPKTA